MERWSAAARHTSRRPYERTAPAGISRAQLLRRGAGVAGGVAGFGLLGPAAAFAKPKNAEPKPIPGGFDENFNFVPSDPFIHVLPPAVGLEMSTITDFNGTIAAGEIQGTAHGSDGSTYGFDADMRFMDGTYVGVDGRVHHGSFGFVWIDLFEAPVGDLSNQVHDFEPGILPSGLFWTIPIDRKAIDARQSGSARYHIRNLALEDYGDFSNAVSPNPSSIPAHATFDVRWSGHGKKQKIRDTTFDFEGSFIAVDARIDFTVSQDGSNVSYSSDPNGQQTVSAGVGKERNGVFFQ